MAKIGAEAFERFCDTQRLGSLTACGWDGGAGRFAGDAR